MPHSTDPRSVAHIVEEIVRRARLPLDSALALPPEAYRSEALLALEMERIFRREWICVGRADEVVEPGDWFSTEVAGEPLLVVRGVDSRVRVLSNACRHRFAVIATGRGRAARFPCPYHAWTYDLEGRLLGAPFMDRARDFDPASCRLPEVRSEQWAGFLYVNLDDDAESLAPRLAPLGEAFANHPLERIHTVVRGDETWEANWKVVAENAMESYHVFQVHPTTLDAVFPTSRLEIESGAAGYNLHTSPMREGTRFPGMGDAALARNPDLAPEFAHALWITCVYPSHVIVVAAGTLLWLVIQPRGIGRADVSFGFAQAGPFPAPDTPQGEAARAMLRKGLEAVNAEDRKIVKAVQAGLASSHATSGRLSHLERPIWEFIGYLAGRLGTST
jgi:choline monooxygenase